MKYNPHPYQQRVIQHVLDHPNCALFLDMGLGKTVATLTAIDKLLFETVEVSKVLVIAPKSVALNTWSGETEKWDHLQHLKLSLILGSAKERLEALNAEADIYVTNRDNVVWLVNQCKQWPFDCVVLDESSSFKNHQAKRYKALQKMRPYIARLIELTGTPAPNGLMDLWAQIRLLDGGDRLGAYIGQYRERYFKPGARNGNVVYTWIPKAGAKETISAKLSDICVSMKAEDYLTMPMLIDAGMTLTMPLDAYNKFQQDCIMEIEDETIEAVTAVALANKLLQFASGAVYDSDHLWHNVDETKMEALDDLVENSTDNLLVFYNYQHEAARILDRHPGAVSFRGEPEILQRWNRGEIRLMLCHPASVAYGLNMQAGGHVIVWFSPTWNLELYEQANARLYRQGQQKPVIRYHLICSGTMDEIVMAALKNKSNIQDTLLKHINQLRND